MAREIAIDIRGLVKVYKGNGNAIRALDSVDLQVEHGSVFGFLGPNGAGKTTTLSILCGLIRPTSGLARVAGIDVGKDPLAVRKQIGVVFQQPSVDDLLSGRENLMMHALLYGMDRKTKDGRIEEILSIVGLKQRADDRIKTYSGGMRKRLEIARALLHRPKILFLDEPTVGLDLQTRSHIWKHIKGMSRKFGTTVVFTTHYLEEAQEYADKVAIIDNGKIIDVGTPKSLIEGIGGDVAVFFTKNPLKVARLLKTAKFARNVKALKNSVQAAISNSGKNLPAILRNLPEVDSMELHPASLNDVFIKHTGRAIRSESGEGGFWERIMNNK
ncbi:ATP-binding cassette domain-containing protein [Candidatus Parvarchaeota archaeon]|nr:ATP-binding cassette domain-containing protein [Candidatus Parvarchaeota archaeon]